MPLPGGAADKFGNRYEGHWTVHCMIDVMDEKANSIRLEPPGKEGEGVEFWLDFQDRREYHQVKRQQSDGQWRLADLNSKGVLANFWHKLQTSTANCVFISICNVLQLDELSDRARRSASWQEFEQDFIKLNQSRTYEPLKAFKEISNYWNCSDREAYEALKQIYIRTYDETSLCNDIDNRINYLVEGEPANVSDVLAQFALDKVHHELTAYEIWNHLEKRGFLRRQWHKDSRVLAAVQNANDSYLYSLKNSMLYSQVIPRDEAETVIKKLTSEEAESRQSILISGVAGVGKSGVMLQALETIHEQGIPVLAFRVDRLEHSLLPNHIGKQLGLPGSPASVLAAIAQKRLCVLIIDQLDAVSLASG
ncbi:hypothetical protein VB834_15335 [Limnoraphis robusta Tam1]|uniref:hypothetical protein n=1 Tax=Limnoraphis robusta TaxID=1118279 RepID=UPI002B21E2CB|nr:hypothetical protein [Limnoraphis robusta]MEA5540398.1 hypothetical protein [Limnoraphis robusta Tam1]